MDLVKQYIVQSISAAANNLRLNTQKIEVVALLRETITRSENLEKDIREMKKITQLSKFAIRLQEIYNYLTQSHVDFFKLSELFKEHSQYLIKDLSSLLESVNPQVFKTAVEKLYPSSSVAGITIVNGETIDVDLSKRKISEVFESSETDIIRGNMILEEEKDADELFHDFELQVLRPVKSLDSFLQKIDTGDINREELLDFKYSMQKNAELSAVQGFDIIAGMHEIIVKSLSLIDEGTLLPEKHIIESIRACLIVIVAVVKGKEIDITNYLNRAEEFGKEIQNIN